MEQVFHSFQIYLLGNLSYEKQMRIRNPQDGPMLSCIVEVNKKILHYGVLDIQGRVAKVSLVHLMKLGMLGSLPLLLQGVLNFLNRSLL